MRLGLQGQRTRTEIRFWWARLTVPPQTATAIDMSAVQGDLAVIRPQVRYHSGTLVVYHDAKLYVTNKNLRKAKKAFLTR